MNRSRLVPLNVLGIAILGFVLTPPTGVRANDGFYQGHGTVLVPVQETRLHVVSEDLTLRALPKPVCFELLFEGRPLHYGTARPAAQTYDRHRELQKLGKQRPCRPRSAQKGPMLFEARYEALAKYRVRAKESLRDVQMGFPVPTWLESLQTSDGLEELEFPGATRFETRIDGNAVSNFSLKEVELPTPGSTSGREPTKKTPAWIWKASFRANHEHRIENRYLFGPSWSTEFFEGREFPKGAQLAMPRAPQKPGSLVLTLKYFLSPIGLWGPPAPEAINVRVILPPQIPTEYAVPMTARLRCLDEGALFFQWRNEVPTTELVISYPENPRDWGKALAHDDERDAWMKMFLTNAQSPAVSLSCRLHKRLSASNALGDRLSRLKRECVESCAP